LLKPLPVGCEFGLMQFGPGFHQPALPWRKRAGHQVDGVDAEDPDRALIAAWK
jgi:hypothetical protein